MGGHTIQLPKEKGTNNDLHRKLKNEQHESR